MKSTPRNRVSERKTEANYTEGEEVPKCCGTCRFLRFPYWTPHRKCIKLGFSIFEKQIGGCCDHWRRLWK